MKTLLSLPLLLIAFAPAARSEEARMRDASTHEQLALAYRKSSQEDPVRLLKPASGADPSLANQPQDLVASSDILCFTGTATLVPKRAVLNIPANLADRLKFQPGSKIQSWSGFLALNRGWITTVEVSRAQAEGNQPIDPEISERIGRSGNVVIATYQGGPISVLPLKATQETANP